MPTTKKAQFNPSTLKASYNPLTKKGQLADVPYCPCEYCVAGRDADICFPEGEFPRHVYVTFEGVKRTSDSSLITELNIQHCLTWDSDWPAEGGWIKEMQIDGTDVYIKWMYYSVGYDGVIVQVLPAGGRYFLAYQVEGSCPTLFNNNNLLAELGKDGTATLVNPCD